MSWVFFLFVKFQVYKTCYIQLHLKMRIHNAQAFSKYIKDTTKCSIRTAMKHRVSAGHKLNIEIRPQKKRRERKNNNMEQQKRDLNITKLKKINNLRKAVKSYDYTLCIKGTF